MQILLQFCEDELNPIGHFIVESLINEGLIQSYILVPSLLNNFHLSDVKARTASLSALSRFFTKTKYSLVKDIYRNLLSISALEKNLIIAAVRSMGAEGEDELYFLMKSVKSAKVRTYISYFLGFRIPLDQEPTLKFSLVRNYSDIKQFPDNSLCNYIGELNSPDFSKALDEWSEFENGELQVNYRDF